MKVLMLTQVLPYPPDSGPKVKTWNVLKALAQHHEVTLVSFVRGDQAESVRQLEQVLHAVHTVPIQRRRVEDIGYLALSFLTHQPFLMLRDDRAAMRRLVDQLARETQFEIVHADQLNMAQYARRVRGARKVLDAHNALWLLYKRLWQTMKPGPQKWLLDRDWRLLKRYEGQVCREFEAVVAVSEEDKSALEEAAGRPLQATIIPIAVDTDGIPVVQRHPHAKRIIHIGTMYWPPNIDGVLWFIKEVFPLVRSRCPEAEFDIVGANPPPDVVAYGQASQGIRVTGYVEDTTPLMENARLMVVPLRAGGGMRVKILNALAAGLPVVSTSLGSEGIAVESGKHLLLADSPADFAEAVVCLLEDAQRAEELGRNGRRLIETQYDYRAVCQAFDQVYGVSQEAP